MARVTGIGGVFLKADDPERLAAWYAEHLGMHASNEAGVIFRHKDEAADALTIWSLFERESDYFGDPRANVMINYRVDDLDGMLAALRSAGAAVDDRIDEHAYGRFAWLSDPEGNRIELWEPPA